MKTGTGQEWAGLVSVNVGSKETEITTVGGWVRGEKAVGKGSEKEGEVLGTWELFVRRSCDLLSMV